MGRPAEGMPRSEPSRGNPAARDRREACGNESMMGAGLRPHGKPWDEPPYPKMNGASHFYPDQRLNLSQPREGPRKICQGFKPDPGNLAVRHYRGASGTVRHGETVNPSCNRKSGNGNLSPTARRARSLSRPRIRAYHEEQAFELKICSQQLARAHYAL